MEIHIMHAPTLYVFLKLLVYDGSTWKKKAFAALTNSAPLLTIIHFMSVLKSSFLSRKLKTFLSFVTWNSMSMLYAITSIPVILVYYLKMYLSKYTRLSRLHALHGVA